MFFNCLTNDVSVIISTLGDTFILLAQEIGMVFRFLIL